MFASLARFVVSVSDFVEVQASRAMTAVDARGRELKNTTQESLDALQSSLARQGETARLKLREEGVALRKGVWNTVFAVTWLTVAAVLVLLGLSVVFVGVYLGIYELVHYHWAAALITGALTLAVAGVLIWISRKLAD